MKSLPKNPKPHIGEDTLPVGLFKIDKNAVERAVKLIKENKHLIDEYRKKEKYIFE
ncbi:hypothetical protein KKH36_02175 [Patescibacteria group bacterium]|nr:hypothetical protein [Patescibacteria group bacterium]